MAELEPGHPDELTQQLANWLKEANDPIGTLPAGLPPTEWAARRFIDTWRKPARDAIDSVEECLAKAEEELRQGHVDAAKTLIAVARQTIGEDIRDHLGLYDWNREDS